MKLILIRRTETNKDAGLAGELDVPSPTGRQQIEKLVAQCRNENVEAVFCSRHPRALFAAEALALALGVPSIQQSGLEERNFGDWDMWEWPQIKQLPGSPLPLIIKA